MDVNDWTAQAQVVDGVAVVGAIAAAMDTFDWRTQLLPSSRRKIVNKIMETLERHIPVWGPEGPQELNKIAVSFEEKIYTVATSQHDYLKRIALKMLAMEKKSQNPMTKFIKSNAACSGQTSRGPGEGAALAAAAAGSMDTADWRTQLLPGSRQRIVSRIKEVLERHLPVFGIEERQELNKIAARFEEKICAAATSQEDYLQKISIKMLAIGNPQYPMINSMQPNAANRGEDAHGPELATEEVAEQATEEEETDEDQSDEDTDNEQATEEDDGDESEESGMTEDQNSAVGHKENVEVGENEISCGLNSGAKLGDCSAQVEERLKKIEADVEEVKALLAGVNEKLNYLVNQDVKAPRGIRRPTKHMRSSRTGHGQPTRKHRIVEIIRQSCKRRRLGRGAVEGVSPVECAKDGQRRSDEAEQKVHDD